MSMTEVAPTKFVPARMTSVPAGPVVGVMPVMVGDAVGATVRLVLLVAAPTGVTTTNGPVVAPAGTAAVI